jgi:nucleolar protein 58
MENLIQLPEKEIAAMRIGLAHSLSRYKLKFSPDKVDTMIVQAICMSFNILKLSRLNVLLYFQLY